MPAGVNRIAVLGPAGTVTRAAEWSPDGRRLLVLVVEQSGGGVPLVRWLV